MSELVNVYFHFGGTWVMNGNELEYLNGEVEELFNFDPNYMSVLDIKAKFKEDLGFPQVSRVYILQLGKSLKDGLFLVENDSDIYRVLAFKGHNVDIHTYAKHGVDEPLLVMPFRMG